MVSLCFATSIEVAKFYMFFLNCFFIAKFEVKTIRRRPAKASFRGSFFTPIYSAFATHVFFRFPASGGVTILCAG
jgi:hypothetical protein